MADSPPPTAAESPAAEPQPVPRWIRVRDRVTEHEYDVAGSAFDPEAYVRVNAPSAYPDLYGDAAQSRPAKFRTDKAGQPVNTSKEH